MARGFVYLFAVLDWASRRVLAWRLSNTLTTDFCLDAVQDAVGRYGHTGDLQYRSRVPIYEPGVHGASDTPRHPDQHGRKGCWRDNVFVERLWKSIKYEEVYLHAYETVRAAHQGLARYLTFYNQTRPHQALDGQTPDQVYYDNLTTRLTAA
jgi:putative transposase